VRFPVALGLFLLFAGFMVTVLHPVYRTGERVRHEGLEAAGPVEVYRPVPPWVGMTSMTAGGGLLVFTLATGGARRRRRPGR